MNGNLFVADQINNKIRKITPAGLVSTFAGSGIAGSADGTGISASFNNPTCLAFDNSGNIFVTDFYNHKIRKITTSGQVTTFAGNGTVGSLDGIGSSANFNSPFGITIDPVNNIYVADWASNRIRKITFDAVVTTLAGSGVEGATDGMGLAASFAKPHGIATDTSGNLYVSDEINNKIRKISTGFTIYPNLPLGLSLNFNTGVITGNPFVAKPLTTYTINASNGFGRYQTTVNIEVRCPFSVAST